MAPLPITFTFVFLSLCYWIKCGESQFFAHTGPDADSIQFILEKHNEKRRIPRASNMKMLEWDESIANQTKDFVQNCDFNHPELNGFGENIHFGNYRMSELYQIAVQAWYDETDNFDHTTMLCQAGKICGHYTQVVWAESERVGCSTARCSSVKGQELNGAGYLTSCRYFPGGNRYSAGVALPPYKVGDACSACEEGWTACNNGLCARPTDGELPVEDTTTPQSTVEVTTIAKKKATKPPAEDTTTPQSTPGTVDKTTTVKYLTSEPVTTKQNATVPDSTETIPFIDMTTAGGVENITTTPAPFATTPVTDTTTPVTTDSTPFSSCSAEYKQLLDEYRESFAAWKEVFQKYKNRQNEC